MYLKRLEITGFKSFANKTVLDFSSHVTAVVGPNGSGKSNVADAIRWVLGEQSMKSLRGKKSEDIIFSGSGKKTRMSAASASLIFDNRDRQMSVDADEAVITRKIFRSGDSEYYIQKKKVRLGEIVEMLSGAGISQKGYCVINQGMADAILVASPQERMVIFEEATGVRKFQLKKEQSIKKLEATHKNLLRVRELLGEIEPHLNFLRRQAGKSAKRGELESELRALQKSFFAGSWNELFTSCETFESNLERFSEAVSVGEKKIETIRRELGEATTGSADYEHHFEELQKQSAAVQIEVNEMERELSILEGRIELEKEKIVKAQKPEYKPVNLGYAKEKISKILLAYENFLERLEKITAVKEIVAMTQAGKEAQRDLKELYAELEAGKVCLKEAEEVDESVLNRFLAEKEAVTVKLASFKEKYAKLRDRVNELNRAEQDKRQKFFALERSLSVEQDQLNRTKDSLNAVNVEVAKFEVRREDLLAAIAEELGEQDEIWQAAQKRKKLAEEVSIGAAGAETENKIRRLKTQLEQIGGIDPLIMEEFKETEERFNFLSTQAEDLENAAVSLKAVIKELDEKVHKLFNVAFKEIDREFGRYFKIVFSGGGKAGLEIKYEAAMDASEEGSEGGEATVTDASQSKIAGIEITAIPQGKKISNLQMLSGGERALTSIAILFAIIAYNPPPFSVLDEIDAALDEANSSRLAQLLKEISDRTQFVIITHNREMMNQADLLYGVTMQEDGVSKVVSVDLKEYVK